VLALKGSRISETLLAPGRVVIGRTPDNDLQVDSKFVSRHHAQVVTTVDGSIVEDLNSTNGVYMRGKRVRRQKLADGDILKLGMHEIAYYRVEQAAHEDERAARTTVLDEADYDDSEAEEEEREA
jgi:pSer/pThr/pTyr-binding forkhead associated (FHA) protein